MIKAQDCTNRQHGRYSIQSMCGVVHADDEKSRAYVGVSNNTRTVSSCRETNISPQRHMINLQKKKQNYLLSQIGNADQMPIYFNMSSNVQIKEILKKLLQNSGVVLNSRLSYIQINVVRMIGPELVLLYMQV